MKYIGALLTLLLTLASFATAIPAAAAAEASVNAAADDGSKVSILCLSPKKVKRLAHHDSRVLPQHH